jgi:hypothetical protein
MAGNFWSDLHSGGDIPAGAFLHVGAFDRWFAAGYVVMVVLYVAAVKFAVTDTWAYLATALFGS